MPSRFGTEAEIRTRVEGLRRFNEWDDVHPEPPLDDDEWRALLSGRSGDDGESR